MKLFFEQRYPLITGLLTFTAGAIFLNNVSSAKMLRELAGPVINASAIATGFLATMQTILLSIDNREVIRRLKAMNYQGHNYYNTLLNYLISAIKACFMVALVSTAGYLVDGKNIPWWLKYAAAFWTGLAAYAVAACYRVISIMAVILRHGQED